MTENIENKFEPPVTEPVVNTAATDTTENTAKKPAIGGMMLRKRVKEGKKTVYRMVYVERPEQSSDPRHNERREVKRVAAQLAKDQKNDVQKEIKKQMDVFDMRFIVASMNKFAPHGYKFTTSGNNNCIALQSAHIMGNQAPRGAFVSDISFDLLFGLYGDLLNGKISGPDENLYERIKFFTYARPTGVSQAQHDKYMNTIKNINTYDLGLMPPLSFKSAPGRLFMNKNAILVQGTMDSGQIPPKYLNDRMHKIVNEIVWWAFRRVMLDLKLSKLQKLRKTYRAHLAAKAIIPGKKFGLTANTNVDTQKSQKQKELEQRLDVLIRQSLPQAIYESQEEVISLHRQMAQVVNLQPINNANIKPSKHMKQQIQREIDDLCSGATQKERIKDIRENIYKTIVAINGEPQQIIQPARQLMPSVFYVNGDTEHSRKIGTQTSVLKQMYWLTFARRQRTK